LGFAANGGNIESAQILLNRSANINAISKNGSPLIEAIWSGNAKMVQFLLDHGADSSATMNIPYNAGRHVKYRKVSALQLASQDHLFKIVRLLN
jgi:ankyrin repeat protein